MKNRELPHEDKLVVVFQGKSFSYRDGQLKRLGGGGEATVCEVKGAKDARGRDVVVKVFWPMPQNAPEEAKRYHRFREAALAIMRLQEEPGFRDASGYLPIVELLRDENLPEHCPSSQNGCFAYFFMPKLVTWNKNGHYSIEQKVDALLQILSSVRSLHDHNMTHRDIKAANILFDTDEKWKLSDFGMLCFESEGDPLTNTGDSMRIFGGPRELRSVAKYEKFRDKFDVFSKSDIYLFGKLCWQIISDSAGYYEGDEFLFTPAAKSFFENIPGDIALSSILDIIEAAVREQHQDRCTLDDIQKYLRRQKEYLAQNNLITEHTDEYNRESSRFYSLRATHLVQNTGAIFVSNQISDVFESFGPSRKYRLRINAAGFPNKDLYEAEIIRNASDGHYYFNCGGEKIIFVPARLFLFRDDDAVLFRIELENPPAKDVGESNENIRLNTRRLDKNATIECLAIY